MYGEEQKICEKQKICAGEDRPNIKTLLIIGALNFAEFPSLISMDYDYMIRVY